LAGGANKQVQAKDATFRVRIISGGRVTIPTGVRELLGVRDGDYVVCSVRAAKRGTLPSLKTLWRILQICRNGLTKKEIAKRSRLSVRTTRTCLVLLTGEELLSVSDDRQLDGGEETYRTTEKGLQIIRLVPLAGGSRQ